MRYVGPSVLLSALLLLQIALSTAPWPVDLSPLGSVSGAGGNVPRFDNVSKEVGLEGVRGDSFAWGDYDDDGHQDLLVKGARLFRNTGPPNFGFQEMTEEVGLFNSGYSAWGDLNGDGYLDIFSAGHPYNFGDSVWLNSGPPYYTFKNGSYLSGPSGVDDSSPSIAVSLGDIDRDGDLDAYVVNWRDDANIKFKDVLWRNRGDGSFEDITEAAGIVDWNPRRGEPNAGMGVNMGDYNNDGWLDIYVSNYLVSANYLFENQKDGTFRDVGLEKGCAGEPLVGPQDTYYGHTAGSQWCDYDKDGDLDLWCSNLAHKDPYRTWICDDSELWRNDGPDTDFSFTNVRDQTGIPTVRFETEELFFGIAWADYDNDGDMDMFIPQIKSYLDYAYSLLFENQGDGTFLDVSDEAGFRVWDSDGGCWCDYDEDGDLDLITEGKYPYENGTYQTHLYRNKGTSGNRFLQVDLVDGKGAPSIGSRLEVRDQEDGSLIGMSEVEGGTAGHAYGPSFTQEFGLGERTSPVDITVLWCTGETTYHTGVVPGSRVEIIKDAPDLSAEMRGVRTVVNEGERLELRIAVVNRGGSDVKELSVDLTDRVTSGGETKTGHWARTLTGGPVKAQDELVFLVDLETTGAVGTHSLEAVVQRSYPPDPDGAFNGQSAVEVRSSNRPPRITEVSLSPETAEPGGEVHLVVDTIDADGDALSFLFRSDTGSFTGVDESLGRATWKCPGTLQVKGTLTVPIEVTVTDNRGGSDSREVYVLVYEVVTPPVILSTGASTRYIPSDANTELELWAIITDDDGPTGIILVEADLSELGLSERAVLRDDGIGGDMSPQAGNFSGTFTVLKGLLPGKRTVRVYCEDTEGFREGADIQVMVVHKGQVAEEIGPERALMIVLIGGIAAILLFCSLLVGLALRRRAS
ncbi:MAG: VCBS repeat-containing protein [Candidatus Thermoplasmatota archaeon]|jgi:hypothetical protein|nr:VCBS repeat-containing protein [Candidatus Thermoplasmatota archaeon]